MLHSAISFVVSIGTLSRSVHRLIEMNMRAPIGDCDG